MAFKRGCAGTCESTVSWASVRECPSRSRRWYVRYVHHMRAMWTPAAAIAALTVASCGGAAAPRPSHTAARSSLAVFSARVNAACTRNAAGRPQGSGGGIYRVLKVGEVPVPPAAAPLTKQLVVTIQASIADQQNFAASSSAGSTANNRANSHLAHLDKQIVGLEEQLGIDDCAPKNHARPLT